MLPGWFWSWIVAGGMVTIGVVVWKLFPEDDHDAWDPFKVHLIVGLMWLFFTLIVRGMTVAYLATSLQTVLKLIFGVE